MHFYVGIHNMGRIALGIEYYVYGFLSAGSRIYEYKNLMLKCKKVKSVEGYVILQRMACVSL